MMERSNFDDLSIEIIILIASFLTFKNAEYEYKDILNLYDLVRLGLVNHKTHEAIKKTHCFGFGMWNENKMFRNHTFEEVSNSLRNCAPHTIARLLFSERPPTYKEIINQSERAIKWFNSKPGSYS